MTGIALGCIGLSLDDFCALTPEEFRAVHEAYIEAETERLHGDWERMRLLATLTVQPYSKKKIRSQELIPFPWDREEKEKAVAPKSTATRFQEMVKKLGGK